MTTKRRQREDEGVAAFGGAAAGQGLYQEAGYSTKHHVDRHTRKGNPGVSAAQVKLQDKTLKPLKAKHGMHLPHGSPGRDNVGYHRAYPTELPHGRAIRVLGHTHEGKLGIAIGAGATVGGAAFAAGGAHHEMKKAAMPANPFLAKADSTKPPGHKSAKTAAVLGFGAGVTAGASNYYQGAHVGLRSAEGHLKRHSSEESRSAGFHALRAHGPTQRASTELRNEHTAAANALSERGREIGSAARKANGARRLADAGTIALGTGAVGALVAHGRAKKKAAMAKAACKCGCGCKTCGGDGNMKKRACTCACTSCGKGMSKSAFGIEHELAKGGLAPILDGGMDAMKGLKIGAKGGSFGSAPGSMSGMLGAKTGNVGRKGVMGGANFMKTNPIAGAGAAAGVGAGGGLVLSRKGNN